MSISLCLNMQIYKYYCVVSPAQFTPLRLWHLEVSFVESWVNCCHDAISKNHFQSIRLSNCDHQGGWT